MKIAFDLDDTLIPSIHRFGNGSSKTGFPANLFFREELRTGTVKLLREISDSHDLWIYTTSLRNPLYLKIWFRLSGIKLSGVVNQNIHLKTVKASPKYRSYSKAPKLFGIDIMIDDSEGVKTECEQQNIQILLIKPSDKQWAEKIRKAIGL